MWEDPIVKEVREARARLMAEHHNDIDELCRDLKEQQKHSGRTYVTRPPRRVTLKKTSGHE